MTDSIKPSYLPTWATDATVAGGNAEAGLATRDNLGGGGLGQGFIGAKRTVARLANWVVGGVCDWVSYLQEASGRTLDRNTATVMRVPLSGITSASASAFTTSTWIVNRNPVVESDEPTLWQLISDVTWLVPLDDIFVSSGLLTALSIKCQFDPAWTTAPTAAPAIALVTIDADGAETVVQTASDPSPNIATLKTRHAITLTLSSAVDVSDTTVRHFLRVGGAIDASWQNVYFSCPNASFLAKPLS